MNTAVLDLIGVVVRATVALVAFTVGMNAASRQGGELRRGRGLLYRSLLGVLVVMPLLAVLLIKASALGADVATGILVSIIAVGPVAALHKSSNDEGRASFALGLDLVLLGSSVVFVPVAALLIGAAFGREVHLRVATVARVILPLQLLPLVAGVGVGRVAPGFAARASRPLTLITNLVLGAVVVLLLIALFRPLLGLGLRGFAATGALCAAAVLVAHVLAGPDLNDRKMLAAFMTLRFPALALALAKVSVSGRRAVPTVLAYLICSGLAYVVYSVLVSRTARRASQPPDSRPLHVS